MEAARAEAGVAFRGELPPGRNLAGGPRLAHVNSVPFVASTGTAVVDRWAERIVAIPIEEVSKAIAIVVVESFVADPEPMAASAGQVVVEVFTSP